jgi:hypothetical protein
VGAQLLDFVTEQIWLGRMIGNQDFDTNPFEKENKHNTFV